MKPKQPRRRRPLPGSSPPSLSGPLVPGDGATLRASAKAAYDKVRSDLAAARLQLERFKTQDKPQFTQWVSRHFGPLLSEMRELETRLAYNHQMLFEIESECFWTGCNHARAYERVMRRKKEPEQEPNAESEPEFQKSSFHSSASEDPSDPSRRPDGSSFEDETGFFYQRPAAPPRRVSARLKELYRALVRKLHPDANANLTLECREWWHEVQEAYAAGDADRLEVILSLCDIERSGSFAQTSVSLLHRVTRQFKASLLAIRRELGRCRFDPAWNFTRRKGTAKLQQQFRAKFESELHLLRQRLQFLEKRLELWAAQAARPQSQRRPSRRVRSATNDW